MNCLDDIAGVVDSSASVNIPQLVGSQEGEVVVKCYNWVEMFQPHFRKLKHIKSYQHYHFDLSMPGTVSFKVASDSEVETINLLKTPAWSPQASDLPQQIS